MTISLSTPSPIVGTVTFGSHGPSVKDVFKCLVAIKLSFVHPLENYVLKCVFFVCFLTCNIMSSRGI